MSFILGGNIYRFSAKGKIKRKLNLWQEESNVNYISLQVRGVVRIAEVEKSGEMVAKHRRNDQDMKSLDVHFGKR